MGIEFGRISGPLLAANLLRDGVDLVFHNVADTDNILYVDVINNRIGVNTGSPSRTLTVLGTTATTNLIAQTRADIADTSIVTNRIQNATDSIYLQPDQASDPTIVSTKFATAKLEISNQLIENIIADSDIDLSPTGKTVFNTFKVNIDGDLHATGNITWDGDVTIGNDDTDSVNFVAEIASDIIPDVDNTYDLGSDSTVFFPGSGLAGENGKEWANLYSANLNVITEFTTENILVTNLTVNQNSIFRSNTFIGNSLVDDQVIFNSHVNTSLIPTNNTYTLGTSLYRWDTAFLKNLNIDSVINIQNNTITTFDYSMLDGGSSLLIDSELDGGSSLLTGLELDGGSSLVTGLSIINGGTSNFSGLELDGGSSLLTGPSIINGGNSEFLTSIDLKLYAAGTGIVNVVASDVEITNNLTVGQLTTFTNVSVTGLLDLTGDYTWTHTGTSLRTGNTNITGSLTVNGANSVQFSDVQFVGNVVRTTLGTDLELSANGTGIVKTMLSDVEITNNLDVLATGYLNEVVVINGVSPSDLDLDFLVDNISISGNTITTTTGNLILSANNTGKIHVTTTDVVITNDLEVNQLTTLANVSVSGLLDLTGDYIWDHTGTSLRTGNTNITGSLTVNGANIVQFADIQVVGNIVRTTLGTDLELSANGTGIVKTMLSDVEITNDLDVLGTGYFNNLTVGTGIATNEFTIGNFFITSNDIITTVGSNIDIVLSANGTGKVYAPTNDVGITNDLTVTGDITVAGATSLKDIVIRSEAVTLTVTQVNQNLSGTSTPTGFFFYGWQILNPGQTVPTFSVIQPGWSCVEIPGSIVTVVGDGVTNYDITITGGSFASGGTYSFTGDVITYGPKTLTQTGNINQTGSADITGNLQSASIVIVPNSWIESAEIKIQGTTVSVKTTNTDLILQANGTGGIIFDRQIKITSNVIGNIFDVNDISLSFNNVLITEDGQILWLEDESDYYLAEVKNDRDLSVIFEPNGTGNVIIDSNKALAIAYGTAVLESNGEIRQNSVTGAYQGFSSTGNVSLTGLSDSDGNTYMTAELTPGYNDNKIRFGINGVEVGYIDTNKLYSSTFHLGNVKITNNQITNLVSSNDLEFNASNTDINSVMFSDTTITNVVDNVLTINSTGTGYVKFAGTAGLVLPYGTNSNKPATPELGQTRYNTELGFVEIWNGTEWSLISGASDAATEEEIAAETNLWAFVLG
jgi:hypothetical protein